MTIIDHSACEFLCSNNPIFNIYILPHLDPALSAVNKCWSEAFNETYYKKILESLNPYIEELLFFDRTLSLNPNLSSKDRVKAIWEKIKENKHLINRPHLSFVNIKERCIDLCLQKIQSSIYRRFPVQLFNPDNYQIEGFMQ